MTEYNPDEFFAAERYARSICMTCANEINCDGKNEFGVVVECSKYTRKYSKPKTNGDRIRSMSDDELADKFRMLCCPFCWSALPKEKKRPADWICKGNCRQCWLDWLKQEADT